MEAVRTSETSVHSNETTRRYIPEDSILHTRRRENLKSHKVGKSAWSPINLFNTDAITNCIARTNYGSVTIVELNIQQRNGDHHMQTASHMMGSASRNALERLSIPYTRVKRNDCVSDETIRHLKAKRMFGNSCRESTRNMILYSITIHKLLWLFMIKEILLSFCKVKAI
jgi:hypothetical protein